MSAPSSGLDYPWLHVYVHVYDNVETHLGTMMHGVHASSGLVWVNETLIDQMSSVACYLEKLGEEGEQDGR